MVVATDKRLVELDMRTLVERQRWERSVRYGDSIALAGRVAVVANWMLPTVALVDLATGSVRRKRHREMTTVLSRPGADPLLVDGSAGGIATIDPLTAKIRSLRDAPPALAVVVSGDAVWLTTGTRVVVTERPGGMGLEPGAATSWVERHPLDPGTESTAIEVPRLVRTIALSPGQLWMTPGPVAGTEQFVLVVGIDGAEARLWRADPGELVEAVEPVNGLVLTSRRDMDTLSASFTCVSLGRP